MKLYADDTKIYHQTVDPIKDPQLLQIDLSNLMEWARKWQLRFNADKCESMRITHTRDKSITQHMLDKPLKARREELQRPRRYDIEGSLMG